VDRPFSLSWGRSSPVKKVIALLLFTPFLVAGCRSLRYDDRKHHITQPYYNNSAILVIKDHVLCNTILNEYRLKYPEDFSAPYDADSLFGLFHSAMERLDLNIQFKEGTNRCDSTFTGRWRQRVSQVRIEAERLSQFDDSVLQLIPIIHLNHAYRKHIYMSQGLAGGGYYIKQTIMRLTIFVVRGEEVLYLSSAKYFGPTYHSHDPRDPHTNLEQEHWDRLVELVMRDLKLRMR
jgi:hypothetical protein